jgi:hypothetical protein
MDSVKVNGNKCYVSQGGVLNLGKMGIRVITEIKGLNKLTYLRELNLINNQITEINGLDALKDLRKLDLSHNQIQEIKGLDALTELEYLNLTYNQIKEIKGLDNKMHLGELVLANNQIQEIKGFNPLIAFRLRIVDLSHNQIQEINGLDEETEDDMLDVLDLSYNQIREIKGLKKVDLLQGLSLQHNQIKEIKGLDNLNALQGINLAENQISGIKGFEDEFPDLKQIILFDNPIKSEEERALLKPTAQIEKSIVAGSYKMNEEGLYELKEEDKALLKQTAQNIVSYCKNRRKQEYERKRIELEEESQQEITREVVKKLREEKERLEKEKFSPEKEKERLENLTALFQMSDRVNINDVAEVLGLSRGEVVKKLIEWKKHFDVRLDGDYINIKSQDVNTLMALLDKSFETWNSDSNKAQKKE